MRARSIGVVAALVLTCGESTPPGPPPQVATALVVEESIPFFHEFAGRTLAFERIELRAAVEGELLSVEVVDDSEVRAGDLLIVIESEAYEAAVERARRKLEQSEASLATARAGLALLQERFAAGEMSRENYEREEADVEQARIQAEARGSALSRAQSALASTKLRAPLSGRIQLGTNEVGSIVGPESGILATITRLHPMRARFTVDRPEVLDDTEYGTVPRDRHDPPARLELWLSDGTLLPDQAVTVTLLVPGTATPRLLVPASAVRSDWRGSFALIVDSENRVERRRIETGPLRGFRRIVEQGLAAGERVVLEDAASIRPGTEVRTSGGES